MQDIPVFTTETGVSTLVLKEIPYKKTAFIRIGDVQPEGLEAHIKECVTFCRMAGAEQVYAAGHEELEGYPLHNVVLQMRGTAQVNPEKLESLFPVTEKTVGKWREIYNKRMGTVENSATLEMRDEKVVLDVGGAYFVHQDGKLLGIGWLEDTKLLAVASTEKGAGERVMHTMMSLVEGSQMELEVVSTNTRAIRLYERLGFLQTAQLRRWYRVL